MFIIVSGFVWMLDGFNFLYGCVIFEVKCVCIKDLIVVLGLILVLVILEGIFVLLVGDDGGLFYLVCVEYFLLVMGWIVLMCLVDIVVQVEGVGMLMSFVVVDILFGISNMYVIDQGEMLSVVL